MSIHPHSLRTASPPPKVQHFEREGGEGIGSWLWDKGAGGSVGDIIGMGTGQEKGNKTGSIRKLRPEARSFTPGLWWSSNGAKEELEESRTRQLTGADMLRDTGISNSTHTTTTTTKIRTSRGQECRHGDGGVPRTTSSGVKMGDVEENRIRTKEGKSEVKDNNTVEMGGAVHWSKAALTAKETVALARFMAIAGTRSPRRRWEDTGEGIAGIQLCMERCVQTRSILQTVRGGTDEIRRARRNLRTLLINRIHDALLERLVDGAIVHRRRGLRGRDKRRTRRLQRNAFARQERELGRDRLYGGGRTTDEDMDALLYLTYAAALQDLPIVATTGSKEYQTLTREGFLKLTRRRQLQEFGKIGLQGRSLDEIVKRMRGTEVEVTDEEAGADLPIFDIKNLDIKGLLQQREWFERRIKELRKFQGERRREAKVRLRTQLRDTDLRKQAPSYEIGAEAVSEACRLHRAIEKHRDVLRDIKKEMKKLLKKVTKEKTVVYIEGKVADVEWTEQQASGSVPTERTKRQRVSRNHVPHGGPVSGRVREGGPQGSIRRTVEDFLEMDTDTLTERMAKAKKRADRSLVRRLHGESKEEDRVGGYKTAEDATRVLDSQLSVCTINVAGMTEVKLDIVLQHMEAEDIDVMVCIDAQVSAKSGRFLGKKAKIRLGTGSVVHVTPCKQQSGKGAGGSYRKIGGIMIIVGRRWGTSVKGFAPDWLGGDGTAAGVLARLTLCTTEGDVCIIGSYWPINHSEAETSDKNLWKLLQRYIEQHADKDRNPTELMKRVIQQWVQTAIKNGAKGAILAGDLNSTWGSGERGGQQAIRLWASENSFYNGPLQISEKIGKKFVTRGLEHEKGSWIDHILHKGRKGFIDPVAAYTDHGVHWEGTTDHRPIWVKYAVPSALEKVPQKIVREQIRWELPLNDRRIRDAFVEGMEKMHRRYPAPGERATLDDCSKYVAETERRSGGLVKALLQKFGIGKARSSYKNGWSPRYMAHKAHLSTLVEIRRCVTGTKQRRRWVDDREVTGGLAVLLNGWDEQIEALDLEPEVVIEVAKSMEKGLNWWRTLTQLPTAVFIDEEIATLKKVMQGKHRIEFRVKMGRAVQLREQMRKDGLMRPVIKSMLDVLAGPRHQEGADLAILRKADGHTTASASEAHKVATQQLDKWFSGSEGQMQGLHTEVDWQRCMCDEEFFLAKTEHTQVPQELRVKLFDAISNVAGVAVVEQQMLDTFGKAPTYDDWRDIIQNSHNNSSGGMSGCSYNQLKMWPEIVSRSVFDCLVRMWESKQTPLSWKWRWLVPIPKQAGVIPSVEDLRPLILVEAVRKVWSKLVLRQLKECWSKHPILDEAQHGYRATRSTMTASLLHLNLLEDAWDSGRPLHSTSWDMSKAFDSVSKNVMRIAWHRVGVPADVTEWLVQLDIGGTTVVRTPYAVEQWNLRGYNAVVLNDSMAGVPEGIETDPLIGLLESFSAERGTGQGDVTSPTCWNAVFDILLTALHRDTLRRGTTRAVRGEGNLSYLAHETAYADDMHSGADSAVALQEKADLVSAFCLVMGLQLSVAKLRRFVTAIAGVSTDSQPDMIVYNEGWTPVTVKAQGEGCLKYLGGLYDIGRQNVSAMKEISTVARAHCAEIGSTRASATTKLSVVTMTTLAKVRYKAKLTTATLAELRAVDKIFYKFHRKISKNMQGFPYELMYLPSGLGGVGIGRFTDLVQLDKLGMLYKGLLSGGDMANATKGMLQRAIEDTMGKQASGMATILRAKKRKAYWLRSLLEWLEEAGCFLCRGGAMEDGPQLYTAIQDLLPNAGKTEIAKMLKHGCRHAGDLIDDSMGVRQWDLPRNCEHLRKDLPAPPMGMENLLWRGQCWVRTDMEGIENIVEIRDVVDDEWINYYKWEAAGGRGLSLDRDPKVYKGTCLELFQDITATRVDIKRTGIDTGTRGRVRVVPRPVVNKEKKEETPGWIKEVLGLVGAAPEGYRPHVYTDGSYVEEADGTQGVFNDKAPRKRGGGSIVLIHDGADWKDFPVIVAQITEGEAVEARSAYTMEFLALAAAMQLQEHGMRGSGVGSDAAAVVGQIEEGFVKMLKPDCTHRVMLQSACGSMAMGVPAPRWVPSHPEKRLPDRADWKTDDWGNHWADRGASGDYAAFEEEEVEPTWITVTAEHMLLKAVRTNEWYIGDANGVPVAVNGVMDAIYNDRAQRYRRDRDKAREGPERWIDSTIELAAEVYNGKDRSVARAGQSSRIIFNKHWHGGNRAKQKHGTIADAIEDSKCHMCGAEDSQDHWIHHCLHPDVVAAKVATLGMIKEMITGEATEKRGSCRMVKLRRALGEGVLEELETGTEPARVWTSCWSSKMIADMDTKLGTPKLSLVQHKSLRKELIDIGRVLATGAREILQIRHNVASLAAVKLRQELLQKKKFCEAQQRKIKEWLDHGVHVRKRVVVETEARREESGDSFSPPAAVWEKLAQMMNSERSDAEVVQRIGYIPITLGTLREVFGTGRINDLAINGYLSLLNMVNSGFKMYCMHTEFFQLLQRMRQSDNKRNWSGLQHFTRHIDIFKLDLLQIPVFEGPEEEGHWAQAVVDIMNKRIQYYDTGGESGAEKLDHLLDYVEDQWRRHKIGPFDRASWKCVASDDELVPQQGDTQDCGILMLMTAYMLKMKRDITETTIVVPSARRHIGYHLATGVGDAQRKSSELVVMQDCGRTSHMTSKARKGVAPRNHGTRQKSGAEKTERLTDGQWERIGNYDDEIMADRLALRGTPDAGIGLFARSRIARKTLLGYYVGTRPGKQEVSNSAYRSAYLLEEYGVVIDAWDAIKRKVTCLVAFVNDPLDMRKVNAEWIRCRDKQGRWQIGLRTLRDLAAGEQIYVGYGAKYWCSDEFSDEVLIKAIQAYWVDVDMSTEETDGLWRQLAAYQRLKEIGQDSVKLPRKRITPQGKKENKEVPRKKMRSEIPTVFKEGQCFASNLPAKRKSVGKNLQEHHQTRSTNTVTDKVLQLPSLTVIEVAKIQDVWYGTEHTDAFDYSTVPGVLLTQGSVRTLIGNRYIEDEVIDAYGSILNARQDHSLFVHTYDTDIIRRMIRANQPVYKDIKNAIGDKLLYDYETIHFPVYYPEHWTLIVVTPATRMIESFDTAFSGRDEAALKEIEQFMEEAYTAIFPRGKNNQKWIKIRSERRSTPHQGCSADCAIFVLLMMDLRMSGCMNIKCIEGIDGAKAREYVAHCVLTGQCARLTGDQERKEAKDQAIANDRLEVRGDNGMDGGTDDTSEDEYGLWNNWRSQTIEDNGKKRKVDLLVRKSQRQGVLTRTEEGVSNEITPSAAMTKKVTRKYEGRAKVKRTPKEGTRRSVRTTRYQGDFQEEPNKEELNADRVAVAASSIEGAGQGLFAVNDFTEGEMVVRYGWDTGLTEDMIKKEGYFSDYLVLFRDLIRDVWDIEMKSVISLGGLVNDSLLKEKENVTWDIHDTNPDIVILRALRNIAKGEEFFVSYGGHYWCHNKHRFELQKAAILRYKIDIRVSTRATQGDWRGLLNYSRLLAEIGIETLEEWKRNDGTKRGRTDGGTDEVQRKKRRVSGRRGGERKPGDRGDQEED